MSVRQSVDDDEDIEDSEYGGESANVKNSGYNSSASASKKRNRNMTLSKSRATTSKNRPVRNTGTVNLKSIINAPPNDFDVMTVNDGLDEIDIMIDQLENDIPEDIYEMEEIDVDEMMKVNRSLRDKIKEIGSFVISAITKAAQLKKRIVTHRDEPSDKDLKAKMNTIKNYQVKLASYKKQIKALNIKLDSLTDNEKLALSSNSKKLIDDEIKELKTQRKILSGQLKHQQETMNKLYDDPDFRDKMADTSENIKKIKENFTEKDEERKKIKIKQERILSEMASINTAKLKLRERKINIENGIKDGSLPANIEKLNEEHGIMVRKTELAEMLHSKAKTKVKVKNHEKEKRMIDIENEIIEIQELLIQKDKENEKLSKEVKDLKKMIPKPGKLSSKVSENLDKSELNNISKNIDKNDSMILGSKDNFNRHHDRDTDGEKSNDSQEDKGMDPSPPKKNKKKQKKIKKSKKKGKGSSKNSDSEEESDN